MPASLAPQQIDHYLTIDEKQYSLTAHIFPRCDLSDNDRPFYRFPAAPRNEAKS